jgi:hypothetical protein
MRIVIEIDDGQVRLEGAGDGSSDASDASGTSEASGASGAGSGTVAGSDTNAEAIAAGPGPGADGEASDTPAADGGAPSAALLEEIAAAEQLGNDGETLAWMHRTV